MIILVGATSHLGGYLLNELATSTSEEVIATYNRTDTLVDKKNKNIIKLKFDITDKSQIDLLSKSYNNENTKIIILSVLYDLDEKISEAWNVNVTALSYFLFKFSSAKNIFFLSSDMIYSVSSEEKYKEDSICEPMNYYGKQKIIGEELVDYFGFTTLRLPVMIGTSLNSKPHFFDYVVSELRNNRKIELFSDVFRSMLHFRTVSEIILKLIDIGQIKGQKINVGSDDPISKYQYGLKICEYYGFNTDLLIPISQDDNNGIWKNNRPKCILLDNSKLKQILNIKSINCEVF